MGKKRKEVVVYAVVDLSCCCRLGEDDDVDMDTVEHILLHSLHIKLKEQIKKTKMIPPSRRLNVVVVGCVRDKKRVSDISLILDRILSTLNMVSNSNKLKYTKYVLLDQKNHGKVIKAQGEMASDNPPEDITGVPLFTSFRQCILHTFTDKRSWWGSTAGQLSKYLKWTNTL